jgi:hypothetical protein
MATGRLPRLAAQINGVSAVRVGKNHCWTVEWRGETKTLDEWASIVGLGRTTLYNRIVRQRWPIEEAMTVVPRHEWHGLKNTREYWSWAAMLDRCRNPNNGAYANYGGRGIKVCERWQKFSNFLIDMGHRPAGHSLERIDNDKGYEPSNCRWATRDDQSKNRRNNRWLTFLGRTMVVSDWAREMGIAMRTLRNRIYRLGWSVEQALTLPASPYSRKTRSACYGDYHP